MEDKIEKLAFSLQIDSDGQFSEQNRPIEVNANGVSRSGEQSKSTTTTTVAKLQQERNNKVVLKQVVSS